MEQETYTLHFKRTIGDTIILSARKPHCKKIKPDALPRPVQDLFSAYARGERCLWRTSLEWVQLISLIGEEEVSKVTLRGKLACYITITIPIWRLELYESLPDWSVSEFRERDSVRAIPQEIC